MADYLIIPSQIAYDSELPSNARLLYGEIAFLCKKNGYCWATNEHFAKLFDTTGRNVVRWINALEERGYIDVHQGQKIAGEKVQRHIYLARGDKNVMGDNSVMGRGDKNVMGRGDKNVTHINTSISNKSINNKSSQIESSNLVSIALSGTDTATTIPQKVQDAYQLEIRPICSQFEQDRLNEDVEHYGEEVVIKAIHRAAIRGKRNLGYVEGILRRWEAEGYDEEGNNGQGFGKAAGKCKRKYDPEYERDKWARETSGWK